MNDTERPETDHPSQEATDPRREAFCALLARSSLGSPLSQELRHRADPAQAWHVSLLAATEVLGDEASLHVWRNLVVHHGSYARETAFRQFRDIDVLHSYRGMEPSRAEATAEAVGEDEEEAPDEHERRTCTDPDRHLDAGGPRGSLTDLAGATSPGL
jgi:hypothetical protein